MLYNVRATERQRHHAEETLLAQRGPSVEMKTSEQEAWLPLQHYSGIGPRQCVSEEPRAGTAVPRSQRQGDPTWLARVVQSFLQMACFSPGLQYKMPHCLGGAADV